MTFQPIMKVVGSQADNWVESTSFAAPMLRAWLMPHPILPASSWLEQLVLVPADLQLVAFSCRKLWKG